MGRPARRGRARARDHGLGGAEGSREKGQKGGRGESQSRGEGEEVCREKGQGRGPLRQSAECSLWTPTKDEHARHSSDMGRLLTWSCRFPPTISIFVSLPRRTPLSAASLLRTFVTLIVNMARAHINNLIFIIYKLIKF